MRYTFRREEIGLKYDLNKKRTPTAQRILDTFSGALLELLQEKSFDRVTVNELCIKTGIPRATYYNYFDDKYDLLDYCWLLISEAIGIGDNAGTAQLPLNQYFDRLYDFLDHYRQRISAVVEHNPIDGTLIASFTAYLKAKAQDILGESLSGIDTNVPLALLADYYGNTVLLILEWIFFNGHALSKQEAHQYMTALLTSGELIEGKTGRH